MFMTVWIYHIIYKKILQNFYKQNEGFLTHNSEVFGLAYARMLIYIYTLVCIMVIYYSGKGCVDAHSERFATATDKRVKSPD